MNPIGEYISLTSLPEPKQLVIVEKEPLIKAAVKAVSPDISVPFLPGTEVYVVRDKRIPLEGGLFIHVDNVLLYN